MLTIKAIEHCSEWVQVGPKNTNSGSTRYTNLEVGVSSEISAAFVLSFNLNVPTNVLTK